MKQTFKPAIVDEGLLVPLRNIRAEVDGAWVQLDLIPSVVLDDEADVLTGDSSFDEEFTPILGKGRPIVEADKCLRVVFEGVAAFVVQDEFVELFEALEEQYSDLPKLPDSPGVLPFLEVENSDWRRTLPDYQGGDAAELKHFKIFSMETTVDILAQLTTHAWVENKPD